MKSSAVVRTFTQTSENTVDYYTTLRTNPSHNSPRSFWHRIYKPDTFQLDSNPGFWSFYDKNEWFCSWTFQNTFNLIPDHHRVCSYLYLKNVFMRNWPFFMLISDAISVALGNTREAWGRQKITGFVQLHFWVHHIWPGPGKKCQKRIPPLEWRADLVPVRLLAMCTASCLVGCLCPLI